VPATATLLAAVLVIGLGLSIPSSWAGNDPKTLCNLQCTTILSGDAPLQSPDPVKLRAAADYLGAEARHDDVTIDMLRANDWLVTSAVSVVPFVGGIAEKALDQLESSANASLQQLARARIDRQLDNLFDNGKGKNDIKGQASQIVDQLIGPDSLFVQQLSLQPTQYDELQRYALKRLANDIDLSDEERKKNIIPEMSFDELVRQQVKLQSEIAGLSKSVAALRVLNEGMGVSAQHARNSFRSASTAAESVAAQRALRVETRLAAGYGLVASKQLGAASILLHALKVDPKVVHAVSTASSALQIASGLVGSFANPLTLLPSLASAVGLFGPQTQGPNPTELEILEQLKRIRQQLFDLKAEIENDHKETMDKLSNIEAGVFGLLDILEDETQRRMSRCQNVIPTWRELAPSLAVPDNTNEPPISPVWSWKLTAGREDRILLNANELQPTALSAVRRIYQDHDTELPSCLDVLAELFPDGMSESAFRTFAISSTVSLAEKIGANEQRSPLYSRYQRSIALLHWYDQNLVGGVLGAANDNALLSLFFPAITVADIDWKVNNLARLAQRLGKAQSNPGLKSLATYMKGEPLDWELVGRAVGFVSLTSWWYNFLGPGDKLVAKGTVPSEALSELRSALALLHVTLAQQATMSGDIILPVAYQLLVGDDILNARNRLLRNRSDTDEWWKDDAPLTFAALMTYNSTFRRNLGLYFAHRRLALTGHSILSYRVAYGQLTDPTWLNAVLGNVGTFRADPKSGTWSVTIGSGYTLRFADGKLKDPAWLAAVFGNDASFTPDPKRSGAWIVTIRPVELPLPTPDELNGGVLSQPDSFQALAPLEVQIDQELVRYTALLEASPEERATLLSVARAGLLP